MLMFLLGLLPMWVFQAVAIGLIVLGFAIYMFASHPMIPKFIPKLIGALMLFAGVFITGGLWTQKEYLAEVEKFKQEVARIEKESKAETARIEAEFKKNVRIVREKGDVIIQRVPEFITKESDDRCDVPNGFVVLHDSASKNEIPDTSSSTDADPSGIKISEVATTVVGNYTTCHEVREQLSSLQEWVRNQKRIHNQE
jgi:hypothetical protein